VDNQRNRGRPWSGTLPPPHISLMQTFEDALAHPRIVSRTQIGKSVSPMDRLYGTSKPLSSSISPRRLPSTAVNVKRVWPKSDPGAEKARLMEKGRRKFDSSMLALADER
jgi:hypothetical protein